MLLPLPLVATSLLDRFSPIPGACESVSVGGCTSGDSIHKHPALKAGYNLFECDVDNDKR